LQVRKLVVNVRLFILVAVIETAYGRPTMRLVIDTLIVNILVVRVVDWNDVYRNRYCRLDVSLWLIHASLFYLIHQRSPLESVVVIVHANSSHRHQ